MYRWVEHTGELELEVEAESEEGVFAEALAAFAELLDGEAAGMPLTRRLRVEGRDRAILLADWLQELVFLAETEAFVPRRLAEIELHPSEARTVVEGRSGSPPPLVKAVTYHGLELEPLDGSWRARVVLDV